MQFTNIKTLIATFFLLLPLGVLAETDANAVAIPFGLRDLTSELEKRTCCGNAANCPSGCVRVSPRRQKL